MFTRQIVSAIVIFQLSFAPFAFADGHPDKPTVTCKPEQDGTSSLEKCNGWRKKPIDEFNKHVRATLRHDPLFKKAYKEKNVDIMCRMYLRDRECAQDINDQAWRDHIEAKLTEAGAPCPHGNCEPTQHDAAVPERIEPEVVGPIPVPAPPPAVPEKEIVYRDRVVYRDPPPPLEDSNGRKNGTGDFFPSNQNNSNSTSQALGFGIMAGMLLGKILSGTSGQPGYPGGYPGGYQPSLFGMQPLGAPAQGGFFGGQPQLPQVYRAPGGPFGNMYGLGSGGLGQPGFGGQIPSFAGYGGGYSSGYGGFSGGLGLGYANGAANIYNGNTFGATYPVTGGAPPTILPYIH